MYASQKIELKKKLIVKVRKIRSINYKRSSTRLVKSTTNKVDEDRNSVIGSSTHDKFFVSNFRVCENVFELILVYVNKENIRFTKSPLFLATEQ